MLSIVRNRGGFGGDLPLDEAVGASIDLSAAPCTHPLPPMHPATRRELIDIARPLAPLVLRWGR
ncbi:hypothetical protein [Pseudacidovorax sp. NFM-22]|uniref:hypothetical protein n=1 Tax=Pseudacidovorax sp. NFM-22 TaxID=2744469 RepID=UPI001F23AD73|nr:hypothetical protein [Pseudacidovorax sp. NFM-22]